MQRGLRAIVWTGLWVAACAGGTRPAQALTMDRSERLSLTAPAPLELAQRALDPAWRGDAADSLQASRLPHAAGKKSPGVAVALAAAVPGTGQLYLGQGHGYVQLGLEVVAWLSYASLHKSGADKQAQYKAYAGTATGSALSDANHWQFDRYCPTTSDCDSTDYNDLLRQWTNDRTRFYESITDTRYSRGWTSTAALTHYLDLRSQSNRFLRLSRYATAVVVVNHVISLIDAVHATKAMRLTAAPAPRPLRVDWAFDPTAPEGPRGRAAVTYAFGR